jgi:uncharacterized protein (TIGR02246 family)
VAEGGRRGESGQAGRDRDPQQAADEAAIRGLHTRVLAGWNEASGDAFAAPFSEDADFVGFDGSVTRGRKRIVEAHQELFDTWLKGTRLIEERTIVRFLGGDVALVVSVGGTVMRGKSEPAPERDSIQSLVAARGAHGWEFVSFQNTRIRPIGANPISALLWLIPDLLWRLFFRASRTTPRKTTALATD